MASWASGNTSVATVDGNGLVTAVAKGTAVITATAGSSKGTVTVTVGGMAAAVTIPPAMDGRLAVE
jgi:alpha-amylase